MNRTDAFSGLRCTDCEERADTLYGRCPSCGGALDATYDLAAVDDAEVAAGLADSLLPYTDTPTAGEGETPLVAAPGMANEVGVEDLYIKDEGRNPTGSFVDRGMSLAVGAVEAAADEGADVEPLALAAAGDGAQSLAAYASRADLRSYGFVPARCPTPVKAMVNVHGGEMRVAGGRYPDAVEGLEDLASYTSLGEFDAPFRHEGAKAVAHEVAADLGETPGTVVIPVGTGELLVGVAKGFRERVELGLANEVPHLLAVQPTGCAPVVEAHDAGVDSVEPTAHPDTIAGELEIPDPPGSALALRTLARHDGSAVAVGDPDLQEGAVAATSTTGLEVGLAGGAAAAAAWERAGDLAGPVVLLNPNSGFKTSDVLRSHLMGQGV